MCAVSPLRLGVNHINEIRYVNIVAIKYQALRSQTDYQRHNHLSSFYNHYAKTAKNQFKKVRRFISRYCQYFLLGAPTELPLPRVINSQISGARAWLLKGAIN